MPERTCVVCRKTAGGEELIRFSTEKGTGAIACDLSRRLPGRGAYIHARVECLLAAVADKALRGAFLRASSGKREVKSCSVKGLVEHALLRLEEERKKFQRDTRFAGVIERMRKVLETEPRRERSLAGVPSRVRL